MMPATTAAAVLVAGGLLMLGWLAIPYAISRCE
jgi:hypothetical protein